MEYLCMPENKMVRTIEAVFDGEVLRPENPRPRRPEGIRRVVGVETPMQASQRQTFKEAVISEVKARRIILSGFVLQAQTRKKLLETDPVIPFNEQSWQVAIQRYITLQPLVDTIATIVRESYSSGVYDIPMDFPESL